jgi:hypothetical protein
MKKVCLVIFLAAFVLGCTANTRAKKWGGTVNVTIPADRQFVNITWKDDNSLWVLSVPREPGHQAKTYLFKEESSFGLVEGKVIIVEK